MPAAAQTSIPLSGRPALTVTTMGFAVALGLIHAPAARADGMAFRSVGSGTIEVQASEQRAILWLRGTVWELHIQPVFPRDAGTAAWVVPLDVRPEVSASSAELFDQLELVTSPAFLTYCWESHDGTGCSKAADAGGNEQSQGGSASVVVWEHGTVGSLDYVVLSASEGEAATAWLASQGYSIPAEAATILADMETEDLFFFAARLSAEADPDVPLQPVKLRLPGLATPRYPLRLTAAGVATGDALDLTLWVVAPPSDLYQPASHPFDTLDAWETLGHDPVDGEEYDQALLAFFSSHTPGTLLLATSMPDGIEGIVSGGQFCDEWIVCSSFEDLGIDAPAAWDDDIGVMSSAGYRIARFQGRLGKYQMSQDLILESTESLPWVDSVFATAVGDCDGADGDSYSYCAVGSSSTADGRRAPAVIAIAVLLALALALILRCGNRERG